MTSKNEKNTNLEIPSELAESYNNLFVTEVDILFIDAIRAAALYSQPIIRTLKVKAHRDPDVTELIDKVESYLKTVIVSAILTNQDSENPQNLRGLPHHDLQNMYIPSWLHNSLSGLGTVYYKSQGVKRILSYIVEDDFKPMTKVQARTFSSMLYLAMKDISTMLVQGVPHEDLGDKDAMSISIYKGKDDVEKLVSHMDKDLPSKYFQATLFPRLKEANARIPAVVKHTNDLDDLIVSISTLNGWS